MTKFKVGDKAGVGCLVDSCLDCNSCKEGCEEYCEVAYTRKFTYFFSQLWILVIISTIPLLATYNGKINPKTRIGTDSGYTFGGYSKKMTVNAHFAIKIPDDYPLESAGPVRIK